MHGPKILVAGAPDQREYYKPYLQAVRDAGGDADLDLPDPGMRPEEKGVRDLLRSYRGILFPGGADIEPRFYGETPHPNLGRTDSGLDEAQLALARAVLAEDLPILGICRGLQLLAVALGAKLYQDLPSERPSAIAHLDRESKTRLIHAVSVDPDSRLAMYSGELSFEVNSRHHQAAREGVDPERIGPFRIVSRAPDGVIEGFEDPARRFCLAVQWHPENLVGFHTPSQRLFAAFLAACRP